MNRKLSDVIRKLMTFRGIPTLRSRDVADLISPCFRISTSELFAAGSRLRPANAIVAKSPECQPPLRITSMRWRVDEAPIAAATLASRISDCVEAAPSHSCSGISISSVIAPCAAKSDLSASSPARGLRLKKSRRAAKSSASRMTFPLLLISSSRDFVCIQAATKVAVNTSRPRALGEICTPDRKRPPSSNRVSSGSSSLY